MSGYAQDLQLRPDENGLSVFASKDNSEAELIGQLFAFTCMRRPQDLDYLLIPPECFGAVGLSVSPVPQPETFHPFLSDRHHEVYGLTPESTEQLTRSILSHSGR